MKVETGLKAGRGIRVRDVNFNAQGNTTTINSSTGQVDGGNYAPVGGSVGNGNNIASNNNTQTS
jgi:hypothetical protein